MHLSELRVFDTVRPTQSTSQNPSFVADPRKMIGSAAFYSHL
jgi:hypothetical protein